MSNTASMRVSDTIDQQEDVFERLQREVIQAGLCTHCGTCVGLAKGALTMRETARGPLPTLMSDSSVSLPSSAYDACTVKA